MQPLVEISAADRLLDADDDLQLFFVLMLPRVRLLIPFELYELAVRPSLAYIRAIPLGADPMRTLALMILFVSPGFLSAQPDGVKPIPPKGVAIPEADRARLKNFGSVRRELEAFAQAEPE